jgi:hypothetical protein
MSAETKAWICTADDCCNVEPQLHKTFCCAFAILVHNCYKAFVIAFDVSIILFPNK